MVPEPVPAESLSVLELVSVELLPLELVPVELLPSVPLSVELPLSVVADPAEVLVSVVEEVSVELSVDVLLAKRST
jgi:hypothetical protein